MQVIKTLSFAHLVSVLIDNNLCEILGKLQELGEKFHGKQYHTRENNKYLFTRTLGDILSKIRDFL